MHEILELSRRVDVLLAVEALLHLQCSAHMSLGSNACAALNIHVNMQACGSSPTSGEPRCVCDGTRLQCVKHLFAVDLCSCVGGHA